MQIHLSLACALALSACLAAAGPVLLLQASAFAEDAPAAAAADSKPLTHATEPLETCMAKWDPGTHMTKEAWRQSCLRIKEEREKYVRDR